jgi:cell shape-determining protein MreC
MQGRTNTYKKNFSGKKLSERFLSVRGAIVIAVVALIALAVVRLALHRPVFGESIANYFRSNRTLNSEVIALQTTLQKYSSDQARLALLQSENDALKAELGRPNRMHGTLASVLFPPGRSLYNTFVIDAGTDEGVNVGMRAYAFGSIALGTVTEVSPTRATVTLYSAQGKETSGTAGTSGTALTLVGRGSGEYEIHMPRDISFSQGEVIAEQSTGAHVLATIIEITADPRDPFQLLRAKAPVNLQALKWVIVE